MDTLGKWKYDSRLGTSAPVIALPERLIKILQSRLPSDVLSDADYDFERALRLTGSGYYSGKPFRSETAELQIRRPGEMPKKPKPTRRPSISIPPHMEQALRLMGVDPSQLKLDSADEWIPDPVMTNEHDVELRRGYCGWLLTHPQFNVERLRLPFQPNSIEEKQRFQRFCSKWFLKDITARLIPEPFSFTKSVTTKQTVGFQGLMVSVPWPHLRSSTFGLRSLVSEQEEAKVGHIKDWLARTGIGTDTYSKLLDLHLYRDGGLFKRYRERRFKGHEKLLQEVFAEYWGLELDRARAVHRDAVSIVGNETARKLSKHLKTAKAQTEALWVSAGRSELAETRPHQSDQATTAKSEPNKSRIKSRVVGKRRSQRPN